MSPRPPALNVQKVPPRQFGVCAQCPRPCRVWEVPQEEQQIENENKRQPAHPSVPMHALHSWGAMPGCQAASQRRMNDRHAPVEHAAVANAARPLCGGLLVTVGCRWQARVCVGTAGYPGTPSAHCPTGRENRCGGVVRVHRWQGLPGPCTRFPAPCSHLLRRLFIFLGRGRACCVLGVPWDVERAVEAQ